jgi:hypothetical protein
MALKVGAEVKNSLDISWVMRNRGPAEVIDMSGSGHNAMRGEQVLHTVYGGGPALASG